MGMLLLAQCDGNIMIVNYLSKSKVLHLALQNQLVASTLTGVSDRERLRHKNFLYFMRPYSDFHIEHNPVLLVHE